MIITGFALKSGTEFAFIYLKSTTSLHYNILVHHFVPLNSEYQLPDSHTVPVRVVVK